MQARNTNKKEALAVIYFSTKCETHGPGGGGGLCSAPDYQRLQGKVLHRLAAVLHARSSASMMYVSHLSLLYIVVAPLHAGDAAKARCGEFASSNFNPFPLLALTDEKKHPELLPKTDFFTD